MNTTMIDSTDYSRELGVMDPNILLADKAFNKHSLNDGHHVSPYDQGRVDVGLDNLVVRLVQGIDEDNFKRVLSKAQRATIGIPLHEEDAKRWKHVHPQSGQQIIADKHVVEWPDDGLRTYGEPFDAESDWEEMLKGGLQTALESQTVVFEVVGVARATTHQIVRSRRAAFHQQSMRASFFGNHPNFRMPESVWRNDYVRRTWEAALAEVHHAYQVACDEDISYQDARYILPLGTETYIMCEYTVREFLALYAYRACSMFQWEICHTVRSMGSLLAEAHPWLAPYIKISCESAQRCTFQGWEDVEDGCDFPWATWETRIFKPEVHRIRSHKEGS